MPEAPFQWAMHWTIPSVFSLSVGYFHVSYWVCISLALNKTGLLRYWEKVKGFPCECLHWLSSVICSFVAFYFLRWAVTDTCLSISKCVLRSSLSGHSHTRLATLDPITSPCLDLKHTLYINVYNHWNRFEKKQSQRQSSTMTEDSDNVFFFFFFQPGLSKL